LLLLTVKVPEDVNVVILSPPLVEDNVGSITGPIIPPFATANYLP
jgi:hypothetical protein